MIALIGQAWAQRDKILLAAAAALLLLARAQRARIHELENRPAPAIEEKVVTKTVQGPVRIVEKIIEKPGGERIVERVIVREQKVVERESEHLEAPICPAPARPPRWIVAGYWNPSRFKEAFGARGGISIGGRLDLSYAHSIKGPTWQAVDVAVRF